MLESNDQMIQALNINSKIFKLLTSLSDWVVANPLNKTSANNVDLSTITEPRTYYYFDKIVNSKLIDFIKRPPYLKILSFNTAELIKINKNSITFLYSNSENILVNQDLINLKNGWSCFYSPVDLNFTTNDIHSIVLSYQLDSNSEQNKQLIEIEPQTPKTRKIIEIKAV